MPELGEPLSEREVELLDLLATGATNRQIAQALHISVNTVKVHVRNILAKLGAASRTEATVTAVRLGLVTVDGVVSGEAVTTPEPPRAGDGPDTRTEAAVVDEAEPGERPLPWWKRLALVVVPLVVAAATVVTFRTGALPRSSLPGDLPPDQPQAQGVAVARADADSRWRRLAQMPTPRAYLAVAAIEGKLVAIGGRTDGGVTSAVEIYDPQADIWSRGADKPTPTAYVSAVALDRRVYVPGGCDADFRPSRAMEVYDPAADSWQVGAALPAPRCAYALAARDGLLYVVGGWDGDGYADGTFVYDSVAETWRPGPALGEPRGFAAAATLDGTVYVVGGYEGRRELTTCALLGADEAGWQPCAPLTLGRGGLGLAAIVNQLFAIGGGGWETHLGFNERYEPGTDTWHPTETPLIGEWRSPGIGVLDYSVYAVGGWSGGYLSLTQAYDVLRYRIFIPVSEAQ